MNPTTPPEGLPLISAGNSDLRPGMWASVRNLALQSGLDFPEPTFIPNTKGAHALVALAQDEDVKNPLIERIYQAYFNRQLDIGKIEILSDLAASFRLPIDELKELIRSDRFSQLLEARRAEAQRYGFLGLPGYRYHGKSHFGALSSEAWKDIFRGGNRGGR